MYKNAILIVSSGLDKEKGPLVICHLGAAWRVLGSAYSRSISPSRQTNEVGEVERRAAGYLGRRGEGERDSRIGEGMLWVLV